MTSPTRSLFSPPSPKEAIEALKKHIASKQNDRLKRAEVDKIFHELMRAIPKAEHGRK